MKTSELIKNLQNIIELHGDNDIEILVKDAFQTNLNDNKYAKVAFNATNGNSFDFGYNSNKTQTFITVELCESKGKKAKISYR